jgi:hypothetical protein
MKRQLALVEQVAKAAVRQALDAECTVLVGRHVETLLGRPTERVDADQPVPLGIGQRCVSIDRIGIAERFEIRRHRRRGLSPFRA